MSLPPSGARRYIHRLNDRVTAAPHVGALLAALGLALGVLAVEVGPQPIDSLALLVQALAMRFSAVLCGPGTAWASQIGLYDGEPSRIRIPVAVLARARVGAGLLDCYAAQAHKIAL